MRRICLTLPTNRACGPTLSAVADEAAYAAGLGVEVELLVLDSSDAPTRAEHARVVRGLRPVPGVTVRHLDEAAQREFLERVVRRAGLAKPELMLDLMLPSAVSYGACTNRAFLIAAALGCESVHRRDSDSRYQSLDGLPVHPVHHEVATLGRRAADAADAVSDTDLDPDLADRPVVMAGSSFIGELSVDIAEIRSTDPAVYRDMVGLWAPADWSAQQREALVEESFTGAGTEPFTRDHATLTVVDPMRVDMCNIAFHQVQESLPLPPATDTIGSDYFLMHVVESARLPGVLHNRNIVNYYTGERRTGPGFAAYQLRFVKFLLSMLYFNDIYRAMAEAGPALLDASHRVRACAVAGMVRDSALLDPARNTEVLDVLDASYRALGGKYAEFGQELAGRRERLLDEARQDVEDFALLIEAWEAMTEASRATGLADAAARPGRERP